MSTLNIGARIVCEGYFGTVRYLGNVEGSSAPNWVGVEWDDSTRGKHDGSHNGRKYFTCKPGCGSFVRPEKLNSGISLLQALHSKYAPEKREEDESGMYVETALAHKVPVQLIGKEKVYDKQKQLNILHNVDLTSLHVARIDTSPAILEVAPNITELDLSHSLLHTWEQVFELLHQLPHLNTLSISSTRLTPPLSLHNLPHFPSVNVLVLNNTDISWALVETIKPVFPQLQELHLCNNNISGFGTDGKQLTGFCELKVLNLESNQLSDWNEVWCLAALPKLERLIVNSNSLHKIALLQSNGFLNLKALSVSHNQIEDWASVDVLDQFQSLNMLRFQNNPVVKNLPISMARIQLTARIGKLTILNGTPIAQRERVDAERYYLRQIEHSPAGHPRFSTLLQLHGSLSEDGAQKPAAHKIQQYSNLVLRATCGKMGEISRRVPNNMRIQDLRVLCEKLFEVSQTKQRLFLQLPSTTSVFPEQVTHHTST